MKKNKISDVEIEEIRKLVDLIHFSNISIEHKHMVYEAIGRKYKVKPSLVEMENARAFKSPFCIIFPMFCR